MIRPTASRLIFAFFAAATITTLWGAVVQTQFNLAGLTSIGTDISFAVRLDTTVSDIFSGFSPTYGGYIVLPSLLVAFAVASWISRRRPSSAPFWFALAGGVAILAGIPLVNYLSPVALLIGASRDALCIALMAIGGIAAGLAFAHLVVPRERMARRQHRRFVGSPLVIDSARTGGSRCTSFLPPITSSCLPFVVRHCRLNHRLPIKRVPAAPKGFLATMRAMFPDHRCALRAALGVFVPIVLHAPDSAAQAPVVLDRGGLSLGVYRTKAHAQVGLSAADQRFATDRFRLSDSSETIARARVDLLLGTRHGFSLDYFQLRTGRSREVGQAFTLEETQYLAGATVSGKFDLDVATAAYRWWMGSDDTVVGVGAGAALYRVRLGLTGRATLNGDSIVGEAEWSTTQTAPLLAFGIRHRASEQVRLYLDASGAWKSGGRVSGHLYNAAVGVEWFPWRAIGLGAEYSLKRVVLERSHSALTADLDLRLDGPSIFLRARW